MKHRTIEALSGYMAIVVYLAVCLVFVERAGYLGIAGSQGSIDMLTAVALLWTAAGGLWLSSATGLLRKPPPRNEGRRAASQTRAHAARTLAKKVQSLSPPRSTARLVKRLVERVKHLEGAGETAGNHLRVVIAEGGTPQRLQGVQGRLFTEADQILAGLSDLYAALLEGQSLADPSTELARLTAWLEAEAEVSATSRLRESTRPPRQPQRS